VLYIFAGLPGAGKTTLARHLAGELQAVHLRIDTIEQALRDAGYQLVGPEGYVAAYGVAADNLRLGLDVVADSVNPLRITRGVWRDVAARTGVPYIEIEVICSDAIEHRSRVESRAADVAGLRLPTWEEIRTREYEPWDTEPVVIDTAGRTISETAAAMMRAIGVVRPAIA